MYDKSEKYYNLSQLYKNAILKNGERYTAWRNLGTFSQKVLNVIRLSQN